jgi:hypothetical protein
MLRLEQLSKNLEAAVCFALFGVLAFVSVYLLRSDTEGTDPGTLRHSAAETSRTQTKYVAARRKAALEGRCILMGSIVAKPISHYGLILRRNPFAPIPSFKGVIIEPKDFILISAPSRETGSWIANIQNSKTGEFFSVGEGEEIAEVLRVKKIEWDKVILSWKESYDIVLAAPVTDIPLGDFSLPRAPSKLEKTSWFAWVENRRTGDVYKVQVGDEITGGFIIKEIDAGRVVIIDETGQEIVLAPPAPPPTPTVDLLLTGTIYIPGQKAWVVQIENRRTGEIYFKRQGEQIEDVFTVGKIERNKIILSREGKEDIVLKLGQTGD